ncbi:MAG: hypothetical protein ACTSO7_03620 [Candidatus Heimdallarchaeota archaeon]
MQKKTVMKFAIIIFAAMLLVGWNYMTFRVVAQGEFDIFNPTANNIPEITDPTTQIDDSIPLPPLGNGTTLPNFSTVFSLMALNLPIEIIFVFLGEVLMGTALKLDPKRLNIKRLGIMIGSALALTIFTSLVYYLMVWPAIHDLAIHNQSFLEDPITEEFTVPFYGDAQPMFSLGVDIVLLSFAMIFILGLHFLALKFIQGLTYLASALSMMFPLIYFPIFWNAISKEIINKFFMETTGEYFTFSLVIAGFFMLGSILLLLWQLTLIGTPVAEIEQ